MCKTRLSFMDAGYLAICIFSQNILHLGNHDFNSIRKYLIGEDVWLCIGYSNLCLYKPHVLSMVKEALGCVVNLTTEQMAKTARLTLQLIKSILKMSTGK